MTDMEQRAAAREFAAYWQNRGDEKQETQTFWLTLLQKVLGVEDADKLIAFEVPVKLGHVSFIDAYIAENRVLIEQKGSTHKLDEKEYQSGGEQLTPYEQAKRYNDNLPLSEKAESTLRSASAKSFVRERIVMASCREMVEPGLASSLPFVFEPVR